MLNRRLVFESFIRIEEKGCFSRVPPFLSPRLDLDFALTRIEVARCSSLRSKPIENDCANVGAMRFFPDK